MYRTIFENARLGRYCVNHSVDIQKAIEQAKELLVFPKYAKTDCEILDDQNKVVWSYKYKRRSEAQKEADKRYAEKHKGEYVCWGTTLRREEANEIDKALTKAGISKAEFIREAAKNLEGKNG